MACHIHRYHPCRLCVLIGEISQILTLCSYKRGKNNRFIFINQTSRSFLRLYPDEPDNLHNTLMSSRNSTPFHTLLILTTPIEMFSAVFLRIIPLTTNAVRFITARFCDTFPTGHQLLMGLVELISLTPFLMS